MGFEWPQLGSTPGWIEGSSHGVLMATPFACSGKRVKGTVVANVLTTPKGCGGLGTTSNIIQQQQEMLVAPHSPSVLIQAKLWLPHS